MLLLPRLRVLLLAACVRAQQTLTVPGETLRLLHVSDVHHHVRGACYNMDTASLERFGACSGANNSVFLRSAIALEQPDVVIFTGDIVDEHSVPDGVPLRHAIDMIYDVARDAGLPFAASFGNHEDRLSMTRREIVEYISAKEGSMTMLGPVEGSPGNYYIDIVQGEPAEHAATAAACAQAARAKRAAVDRILVTHGAQPRKYHQPRIVHAPAGWRRCCDPLWFASHPEGHVRRLRWGQSSLLLATRSDRHDIAAKCHGSPA